MDLSLLVDPTLGRRAGIEAALRDAVVGGLLAPGIRLPSTRALAAEHGVARATVVAAYEQLVSEGYLHARRGAGTVVADVRPRQPPALAPGEPVRSMFVELLPGEPDPSSFPRAAWLASTRRVLGAAPDDLLGYGDPLGDPGLRAALAGYLGRARSVDADPRRIVVFGGFTSALASLVDALRSLDVTRVAMEDPCLPWHPRAVRAAGAAVVPVAVDADGIRVQDLTTEGAVVCTPTHQYPMGVALAPERRAALVAWARDTGAWIVEDDYDGEFRYDRSPVGALQGLDPERVVYAGTASKALAPAIGIAWLVLPPALVRPVLEAKRQRRAAVSGIGQATLADLLDSGRFDRHVRRVRTLYRRRRDAVVDVLGADHEVLGLAAGLHVTAITDREDELIERAAARGVALFGIRNHVIEERRERGLVLGYSRSSSHSFARALDHLRGIVA